MIPQWGTWVKGSAEPIIPPGGVIVNAVNVPVRIIGFALFLALVFAAAALAGSALGPEPAADESPAHGAGEVRTVRLVVEVDE